MCLYNLYPTKPCFMGGYFFRGMELLQKFRGMHKTEILKSQVLGVKENMLTPTRTQGVRTKHEKS